MHDNVVVVCVWERDIISWVENKRYWSLEFGIEGLSFRLGVYGLKFGN
jgi:hypothetical protein